jgi:hypothetical protein
MIIRIISNRTPVSSSRNCCNSRHSSNRQYANSSKDSNKIAEVCPQQQRRQVATEGKPEAMETPVAEGTLALVGQAVPAGTSHTRFSSYDNSGKNTGNSRITSSTREG